MWDQAATKLPAGPHGLDPAVVERVQRERILDAMTHVVAEIGYQSMTVTKVLDRAQISKITFYELFDNKEQCFIAAYDDAMAHAFERIERACAAEALGSPQQRLGAGVDALLDFFADEPDVARLCVLEVLAAGPAGRERRAATMDRLSAMMEALLAEVRPDGDLGALVARGLVGAAEDIVYAAVDRGQIRELPQLAEQITELQLKLINA
jgi:AcrR family transcriptional regulator